MPSLDKASATRMMNVRVPVAVYEKLEALADATARSKSFVAIEALSTYLEAQAWQIQEIEAGIREADAEQFASDTDTKAVLAKYGL